MMTKGVLEMLNRKSFFSTIAGLFVASRVAPAVAPVVNEPTLREVLTGLVDASYQRYPQLLVGKTVDGVFVPDEFPVEAQR